MLKVLGFQFIKLLQIRREEVGIMLYALYFAFLTVALTALIRVFSDSLFLTNFSSEYVPYLFVTMSLTFIMVSIFYSTAFHRANPVRLNTILLIVVTLCCIAARPLLDVFGKWFIFFLSLMLTVFAHLSRIICWNTITDCFDSRKAKRLLPLAGAGSTVGAIVAGLVAGPFIDYFGTDELLYLIALLCIFMIPLPKLMARRSQGFTDLKLVKARMEYGAEQAVMPEGFLKILSGGFNAIRTNKLVSTLAVILFLGAIVAYFVEFQFKTALQRTYSKNEMGIFLGQYIAILNSVILIFQLLLVGRVLSTLSIRTVFLFLPGAVLVGAGAVAFYPMFIFVVALHFIETLLRYTFNSAAGEMILTPVSSLERNRAKVVIKGVTVPLGWLTAGLLLVLVRVLVPDTRQIWLVLAIGSIIIILIWVMSVYRIRGYYLDELKRALGFGRITMNHSPAIREILDEDAIHTLKAALESDDAARVDLALEFLSRGFKDLTDVQGLIDHEKPHVRIACLMAIAWHKLDRYRDQVVAMVKTEDDPSVVKAALYTLRGIDDGTALPAVRGYRRNKDQAVRVESHIYLYHLGDGHDKSLARAEARRLLSQDKPSRLRAIYLIGEIGRAEPPRESSGASQEWPEGNPGEFRMVLEMLLRDEDPAIRQQAYTAVGKIRARDFVPLLARRLSNRGDAPFVATALSEFGPHVISPLVRVFHDPDVDLRIQAGVLRVLGDMEFKEATLVLYDYIHHPEHLLREQVIRSLGRLKERLGDAVVSRPQLKKALEHEMEWGWRYYGLIAELEENQVVRNEAGHRLAETRGRIFGLLSLLFDSVTMKTLHARYKSGSSFERANTVELLENLVKEEIGGGVVEFLEETPLEDRLVRGREICQLAPGSSFQDELMAGPDRWMKIYLAWTGSDRLIKKYPDQAKEVSKMIPILERVILLKSVSIFSSLSGEAIYHIAEIAEEINVPSGGVIFRQGDMGDSMYVVIRGAVSIRQGEVELARRGIKECFGEMAVLDQKPRSATVVALENTELLRVSGETFNELMEQHVQISRGIIQVLLDYIRATNLQDTARLEHPLQPGGEG